MEKITFVMLTPEGLQQILLADIKKLRWQLDCIDEILDRIVQRYAENGLSETTVVHEELEQDRQEIKTKLDAAEKRHWLLTGYYSDGIPF